MKKRPEGIVQNNESPQEYCRKITKKRASNFYWAIATLPRDKRAAVYSIYAFARRCDDIADSDWETPRKRQRLGKVRENIKLLYEGKPQDDLYLAVQQTVKNYSIPRVHFDQLVRGVEMDMSTRRYSTFKDLKIYCFRVASVVGLILIEIFGYTEQTAKKHAIDLGYGMQLTNIIRDVSEDYHRDRVYIPQGDLENFDCDLSKVDQNGVGSKFRALMDFQAHRARGYFNSGKKLFAFLPFRARVCPAGLYGVYRHLLEKMEDSDWEIWNERVELNSAQKIFIVFTQWFKSLTR